MICKRPYVLPGHGLVASRVPGKLDPSLRNDRINRYPVERQWNTITNIEVTITQSIRQERADIFGMSIRAPEHQNVRYTLNGI